MRAKSAPVTSPSRASMRGCARPSTSPAPTRISRGSTPGRIAREAGHPGAGGVRGRGRAPDATLDAGGANTAPPPMPPLDDAITQARHDMTRASSRCLPSSVPKRKRRGRFDAQMRPNLRATATLSARAGGTPPTNGEAPRGRWVRAQRAELGHRAHSVAALRSDGGRASVRVAWDGGGSAQRALRAAVRRGRRHPQAYVAVTARPGRAPPRCSNPSTPRARTSRKPTPASGAGTAGRRAGRRRGRAGGRRDSAGARRLRRSPDAGGVRKGHRGGDVRRRQCEAEAM